MSGWETPSSARKRERVSMYLHSPMSGTPVGKILRSSSIVPSSSRSTQSMSETPGSVLGTGEYACVVPGDICPPSTNKPVFTYNMVSKIVEDQDEIAKINTTTQQLQTVPNWDTVLIHPLYSCTIDQPPTGCTKKGTSPLSVFVMRQGIPLDKYLQQPIADKGQLYDTVTECLRTYKLIFHKLEETERRNKDSPIKWLHGDIKLDNIVILHSNGGISARLIDYNPYSELVKSATIASDTDRITEILVDILKKFGIRGYNEKNTELITKTFNQIYRDYQSHEAERQAKQKAAASTARRIAF